MNLNIRWVYYSAAPTDEKYAIEPNDTLCIHEMFNYNSREAEINNWDQTNEAIFEACITLENEHDSYFEISDGDEILVKWQKLNPDNNLFFSINVWKYKEISIPHKKRKDYERCWYFHITEDMLTKE